MTTTPLASGTRAPLSPLGSARQRLDPQATFVSAWVERMASAGAPDAGGGGDLLPDLEVQDAFLAFEVAGWASQLTPAERHRFEGLIAALLVEVSQGSTRIAVAAPELDLLARVPELVGAPGSARPFILAEGWLTPHRLHAAEARLAAALGQRLRPAATGTLSPAPFAPAAITQAVAEVAASSVPPPSDEQQHAVATALAGRLGVITGGPGTGKTTVVLALVRSLARLGVAPEAIALAAPTGKAANRLGEAMRTGLARLTSSSAADQQLAAALPVPETLHRLLRHSPSARAFAHDQNTPLPFAAVIVDESSMIDLGLMDRLLAALAPETLLVLLGDADQLPSVEAGAVFRDLAPLGIRLQQSHRMDPRRPEGRRILELANAVRAGTRDVSAFLQQRTSAAALAFDGVELCPAAAREEFVARWFDEKLRGSPALRELSTRVFAFTPGDAPARASASGTGFGGEAEALFDQAFDHHQRFRLLAVTHGRPTGTAALNTWMHTRFGARGPGLVPGEPVMMLRNDYERGLWNGDQGLIVNVSEPAAGLTSTDAEPARRRTRLAAIFKIDARWMPFPLDGLRDTLNLAFALTVHKAQGSEYDEVALVLPDAPHPLLTRDLLYTALTRCRSALILCGEAAVLSAGIGNAIQRTSGLGAALSR